MVRNMEDIRFDWSLEFNINKLGYVNLLRNKNFTYEWKNGKEFYSLIYVENGELEYYLYNTKEKLRIEKGTLLFIPKHFPYKTKYLKNSTKIQIIIFDFSGNSIPFQTQKPFSKHLPEVSETFSFLKNHNANNILLLHSKLYELFYYIQNEDLGVTKKYKKILPSISEIEKNYFENCKISYYADMCDMSESNFRKLFKEYKKVSPIEYRNIIRCREVKKMLDSGEFTVSEAAYLAGFNNMSFFYEVYNKYNKHFKK